MAAEFDFIVVGAGAGGGPLACRLALAPEGYRVALLEAGGDPGALPGSATFYSSAVPALHTFASEDPEISWGLFVQHYANQARQQQDPKWVKEKGGVLYPRGAALGGSTAVHALITMTPHHDDWTRLQTLTGDDSWSPSAMRAYFEQLEECRDLPPPEPGQTTDPVTRHGLAGWLPLSSPDPGLLVQDRQLVKILFKAYLVGTIAAKFPDALSAVLGNSPADRPDCTPALAEVVRDLLEAAGRARPRLLAPTREVLDTLRAEAERLLRGEAGGVSQLLADDPGFLLDLFRMAHVALDPNRWFDQDRDRVGAFSTPASILHGVRSAVRERILAVRARYPDRLQVITNALATRVLIANRRAEGVEYLRGEGGASRYRAAAGADPRAALPPCEVLRLRPRGEVILSGGTFSSPQLLLLSGVGPAADLKANGLPVSCDLRGVGQNLQDRYEVTLVSELPDDFALLEGGQFRPPAKGTAPDPALRQWENHGGVYTTNGVVLTILKRSATAQGDIPDLCLFGVPGNFTGYYPGYAEDVQSDPIKRGRQANHRRFSWGVLKARTRNRAGTVTLASRDPRDPPKISFRYFDEGTPGWEKDLDAVVEGVRLAAAIMKATGLRVKTLVPDVDLRNTEQLKAFIQREAWGHHACGTCKIGKDRDSVLDGDFRVRGVESLRVVDASVFPENPGFFLVAPIYMISEKASDVILRDRRTPKPVPWPQPVPG
jgi:choline dehydrogenase